MNVRNYIPTHRRAYCITSVFNVPKLETESSTVLASTVRPRLTLTKATLHQGPTIEAKLWHEKYRLINDKIEMWLSMFILVLLILVLFSGSFFEPLGLKNSRECGLCSYLFDDNEHCSRFLQSF